MCKHNAAHQRDGAFKLMIHSLTYMILRFSVLSKALSGILLILFPPRNLKYKYNTFKDVFLRRIKIRRGELPVTAKNFRDLKHALRHKGKVNIHMQNSLF